MTTQIEIVPYGGMNKGFLSRIQTWVNEVLESADPLTITPYLRITIWKNIKDLQDFYHQEKDELGIVTGEESDFLAELHGNIAKLRCKNCGNLISRSEGFKYCRCGGELVKSVVDFGEPLPEKDLQLSFEHSRKSDLFVVVGSSLVVTPAADMPREALLSGAKLVIINQGKTPFDHRASLRFHERIGDVLPRAVKRLKKLMSFFE